jgi:hypothetical protein
MKTKNAFLSLSLMLAFSGAFAQESSTATSTTTTPQAAVVPAKPKWKASIASYYYNFEGTKAAKENLYTFGDSILLMQLMTLQYEVSPNLTVMVLGQHLDNYVETKMFGQTYRDRTIGMGDTLVSAISPLYLSSSLLVFGDAGVSIPTGSINFRNESNPAAHYAYNMQAGSGTYDAVVGIMPMYIQPAYQLGTRLSATVRTGRNANEYRLGNLYRADAWADFPMSFGLTPRLVGYYKHKDSIDGYDKSFDFKGNPYFDFYHHAQINWDVSAALKYAHAIGPVALSAEVGIPVAQDSANIDNVVVSIDYYGNLTVGGTF